MTRTENQSSAILSSADFPRPDRRWFDHPMFQSGVLTIPGESDLGDQARLLNQILMRRRTEGALELPAFPKPIIQLLELLKNPNVDTAKIVKCLKTDPVVAAEVLRFANSALYAPSERILDLRHAISFLGFRRLHALALGIATKVASGNIINPKLNDQLWIHSVSTGVLSTLLARELHVDQEAAFLGGLLHDVGKIAVAIEMSRIQKKLILNITDRETQALLELNHLEMGRRLALHWRLPSTVVSAIVYHHSGEAPESDHRLVAVVTLADKLCYAFGLGVPVTPFAPLHLEEWRVLGVEPHLAEELLGVVAAAAHAEIVDLS